MVSMKHIESFIRIPLLPILHWS
uniref:Uncharacterized protein n=1 Tax=Arundo donax TaxID=35708 RepID=A0A0A9H3Q8_ARUDO